MSSPFRAKSRAYRQSSKVHPVLKPKQPFLNIEQLSTTSKTVILILLSLLAVTPRLFFIDVPFERDEGVYAYISDVIDRGGIPYRDAFDHKPPLIYYIYNVSFALFGHSIIAPRLMAILFTAIACLYVFLIVYHISHNKIAGVLSMMFLGLSSASPVYSGFNTNTEIFTLPFLTAGSYYLLVAWNRLRYFIIAGLLFGLAFTIKQVALIIAAPALMVCSYNLIRERSSYLKAILLFGIGFFTPLALFTLYFIFHDSFYYFWNYFFTYNLSYVSKLNLSQMIELLLYQAQLIRAMDPIIWISSTICFILFLFYEKSIFYRLFIVSLVIGSMIATIIGRYFYGHYFIVMLPFLSIAIGVGSSSQHSNIKRYAFQTILIIGMFVAIAIFAPFTKMPQQQLLENLYGNNPFYQSVGVGRFLKSTAKPNSTVFIVGSEGQILFYSGLPSATSIFYFYPLTLESPLKNQIRDTLLNDIQNQKPTYVLLVNTPTSHFIQNYSDPLVVNLFALLNGYKIVGISLFNSTTVISNPHEIDMLTAVPPNAIVIYQNTNPN